MLQTIFSMPRVAVATDKYAAGRTMTDSRTSATLVAAFLMFTKYNGRCCRYPSTKKTIGFKIAAEAEVASP
jgi:hypothetical protein